ncbi:UNVERIFIED_CONTAM: hypothetical protein Sradi_2371600 [Sesamum radiatum]|uniref:DUF7046 domain-containing protein n=1 Tax=Sesamum radiatum TaxID=300843 RepID=A0AAW2T6S2_SESRA
MTEAEIMVVGANKKLGSKSGGMNYQNPPLGDRWADNVNETGRADQIVLHLGNQIGGVGDADINSEHGLPRSVVLQTDIVQSNKDHAMQTQVENQFYSSKVNGSLNMIHGGPVAPDSSGLSQFVSPSITLFTPTRYQQEGNPDPEVRYPGRDSVSMAEVNNTTVSKQDIAVKVREHEQEILQLKKHLTDFSIKEAQIQNEKYALEKRISYMRLAFDQQQQDLVLAASKAISYRQDIMEENVRLTYALQAAKQERLTFVSSLMPLLAEYSLQPPVADAQSIVSNVKVLFRHLQEQLLVTEGKLKESQYQLAPWRSDVNPSNFAQSPVYPIEGELVKVFANEHRKITCDPVMHNCIEKTLYTGHASYKLSLSTGYLDIWEPATLAIKRDGYSIKCSGPSGVVVAEKFSTSTIVSIPYGSPTEFSIDSQGTERILRVDANSTDISGSRDTIVLTLRLFILKVQFLLVIILPENMWDMCKILYMMCMLGNPQKRDLYLITDSLIFSESSRTRSE